MAFNNGYKDELLACCRNRNDNSFLVLKYYPEYWCLVLRVKVEYVGHIKNIIGSEQEEEIEVVEGTSVSDLLMVLANKYGEPFRKAFYDKGCEDVKPNYIITVNGYLLNQLEGIKTKLNDGDRVALLPIVSGG